MVKGKRAGRGPVVLCKHAVDLEWIDRNPVVDVEKLEGGEFKPWSDTKLKAYEAYCDNNGLTIARTIYEMGIGTGQRIGDCVKMMWDDFDGEYMAVVQEKTNEKIEVFCPPRLQAFLANMPKAGKYIMAKNLTQHLDEWTVQKAVEAVREKIGAMHGDDRLVPHGWRYTAAVQLAEADCSDRDIQAVTGHRTAAMVEKYRAQANQKVASKRAQQMREQNMNVRNSDNQH